MKNLTIVFLTLMMFSGISAATNPFAQSALNDYEGVYASKEFKLRLRYENSRLTGELIYDNKAYPTTASLANGGLKGAFSEGNDKWSFSLTKKAGDEYTFRAVDKTATMKKLPAIEFVGSWDSDKMAIHVDKSNNTYTGIIKFNGGKFAFSASRDIDRLKGKFKSGDATYDFELVAAFTPEKVLFESDGFKGELENAGVREARRKQQETELALKTASHDGLKIIETFLYDNNSSFFGRSMEERKTSRFKADDIEYIGTYVKVENSVRDRNFRSADIRLKYIRTADGEEVANFEGSPDNYNNWGKSTWEFSNSYGSSSGNYYDKGKYKAIIYINGVKVKEIPFKVD